MGTPEALALADRHVQQARREEPPSVEEILASARRYDTKTAWLTAEQRIVLEARKLGPEFYARCTEHMPAHASRGSSPKKWSRAELAEIARRFSSQEEWQRKSGESFRTAKRYGWQFIDTVTEHMADHRSRSVHVRARARKIKQEEVSRDFKAWDAQRAESKRSGNKEWKALGDW